MNRQYITRYIQPIYKTIFSQVCCVFVALLLTLFLSSSSFAKDKHTYGPIQKGQSLWTIAEETQTNHEASIEQIVYAFYHLNPNAFQSNNMNLLKIGSYIIVPDTDIIQKTNSKIAKQSLSKHAHALALLRADAKQLKKSKQKIKKYQHQIKKIQRNLAKYRYQSKRWNSTYRKLVKAKRRYTKSKRESRELRKLLLEKSTLITKSGIKKSQAPKADHVVIEKLSQIQGQLTHLQEANQILIDKSKNLEILTKRMKVLEDELGATDQLVVQLKNTVESIHDDIKEQDKTTDVLQKSIEKLKNHQHEEKPSSLNRPQATQQNDDMSDIESLRIKLSPTEQATFAHLNVIEKAIAVEEKPKSEFEKNAQIKYHSSKIKHASFLEIEKSTFKKVRISSHYQAEEKQNKKSDFSLKFITIGGYINGLILIFVLFLLFFRRSPL